jgi:hypothetical protein
MIESLKPILKDKGHKIKFLYSKKQNLYTLHPEDVYKLGNVWDAVNQNIKKYEKLIIICTAVACVFMLVPLPFCEASLCIVSILLFLCRLDVASQFHHRCLAYHHG